MKGRVTENSLDYILDALPFEFSFVDSDDRVQLFNKNGDRIFPRSEGVIGLRVQNCHPSKSVDKVEQILREMKAGEREQADFWIDLKDKKILIRYFAVRSKDNKYLGCLEVSQDITEIQKLEGEKRLLD
jgi:PAS domain S-box-containing protein